MFWEWNKFDTISIGERNKFGTIPVGERNKSAHNTCVIRLFTVSLQQNPQRIMAKHVFKRKIYDKMLRWKQESLGQSALLIEGARRVGKSTIVREFAKNEYRSYLLLDFNFVSAEVLGYFEHLDNLDLLFLRLQNYYDVQLVEHQSVIVFDEVQRCPAARQAIKYLVQDGRYDYIETGSLISIRQNTQHITIPSEEHRLELLPLDYEEFLWATGKVHTMDTLHVFFDKQIAFGQAAHRKNMRDLRIYMLVGGMPQAVCAYIDTNNMQQVDTVKREILQLYADDLLKIDPTERLSRLFLAIPSQLSKNGSRYTPTSIVDGVTPAKMTELLRQLESSKTIYMAYHADDPNVGLSLNADYKRFKIFLCDTGLFVTLAFWDKDYTENVLYGKLLSDKLPVNLGYVFENMVAQMLRASGNRLFYYTFPKDTKHNYEIDFLLSRGSKLMPIEVKSSDYKTHPSIDAFAQKFSARLGQCYLLHARDITCDQSLICLPIYLTPFI